MKTECPGCERQWNVKDQYMGRGVTCPGCKAGFVVKPLAPPTIPLARPAAQAPRCPVCSGEALQPPAVGLGERGCPDCRGTYLDVGAVHRLMSEVLKLDTEVLSQLEPFSRGEQRHCPGCGGVMATIQLRQVPVEHCRSCSSMWLDGGELHRATGGRHGAEVSRPTRSPMDGEPEHLQYCLEEMMTAHRRLRIRQDREWGEILLGWETANRYAVRGGTHLVANILEKGEGLKAALLRQFLGSRRPLDVQVLDTAGRQALLSFRRPFFWFLSNMEVRTPAGNRLLGRVRRRFRILHRWYDLHDENGRLFATIRSPLLRFWTFPVYDRTGTQRAMIAKKWSGLLQECCSDADDFGIDFGDHRWTLSQRCVLFAAAVSIDFDFFENNQNR